MNGNRFQVGPLGWGFSEAASESWNPGGGEGWDGREDALSKEKMGFRAPEVSWVVSARQWSSESRAQSSALGRPEVLSLRMVMKYKAYRAGHVEI